MSNILHNALRTPDGTVIESRYRWHYVTHKDANGKEYMVDGGLAYLRHSAHGDEEMLTVTLDDPHEVVREAVTWGTYGPNGDQPMTYVKLADMTTDHIEACLRTQDGMAPQIRTAMENELMYRRHRLLDEVSEFGQEQEHEQSSEVERP